MKTFRLNLFILLLFSGVTVVAQTKKLDKTYKTDPGVVVNLETTHTNIDLEYWNKNEVAIEAMLETDNTGEAEEQKLLASWKLETRGSSGEIFIKSGGGNNRIPDIDMAGLEEPLAMLPEIIDPMMQMLGPLLENISRNPLPPEFYENMGDLNFDYEAYRADGDKYMEEWEKKIEENFGEDFERSMEEWASNFENDSVLMEEELEAKMEAWGEKFGESMEQWGESFGEDMESWAQQFEEEMENNNAARIKVIGEKNNAKAKRSLIIKMPKTGKLNMNVRYGEVDLGGTSTDMKASFSHSKFTANIIDGEETNIKASYSPVKIEQWNYGVLNADYVANVMINEVRSIKLDANSSDVEIGKIEDTGLLSGSFGKLEIGKLDPDFRNLDVDLENSDLELSIPDAAFNFNYKGTQSKIDYPETSSVKATKSYDDEILNGYYRSRNGKGNISIKASFSEVLVN